MFFIKYNQLGILSYQIRQLLCRARGARAHYLCSYLPFHMDSFVHGNIYFYISDPFKITKIIFQFSALYTKTQHWISSFIQALQIGILLWNILNLYI